MKSSKGKISEKRGQIRPAIELYFSGLVRFSTSVFMLLVTFRLEILKNWDFEPSKSVILDG